MNNSLSSTILHFVKENQETNKGDLLVCSDTIDTILAKVDSVLNLSDEKNIEIQNNVKIIYTITKLLETIFNPQNLSDNGLEENELYYHTPIIGIFHKGIPIALSQNYVECLGATDVKTLKKDISNGSVFEKYYTKESFEIAQEAVKNLKEGKGYKGLLLTTKTGNKIVWNSFGTSNNQLEIRIGQDITHGQFYDNTGFNKSESSIDSKLSLRIRETMSGFIRDTQNILNARDISNLSNFTALSDNILGRVWTDGQHMMNLIIDENKDNGLYTQMLYNSNYLNSLGLTISELNEKIKNGTLLSEHYDEETKTLIEGLYSSLYEDGHYMDEFTLVDTDGKKFVNSWFRKHIKDEQFGVDRTFGIGSSVKSKEIAEIEKSLL